ncbi:hypothetical protein FACS189481_5850 [Clostridia bacterium]|nr:hypothetical protein FACS189481_5850 [Clostridia bacterium]
MSLNTSTVEAVKKGGACVNNKGKTREIPISPSLARILKGYIQKEGIVDGAIFRTRNNLPIGNPQINRELKRIAGKAKVNRSKIHPHNFRHLFAKTYMEKENNVVELADILGHSSLETTRIYTRTSTKEKAAKISRLGL